MVTFARDVKITGVCKWEKIIRIFKSFLLVNLARWKPDNVFHFTSMKNIEKPLRKKSTQVHKGVKFSSEGVKIDPSAQKDIKSYLFQPKILHQSHFHKPESVHLAQMFQNWNSNQEQNAPAGTAGIKTTSFELKNILVENLPYQAVYGKSAAVKLVWKNMSRL